jgi:ferric iron reductase protein FhuF
MVKILKRKRFELDAERKEWERVRGMGYESSFELQDYKDRLKQRVETLDFEVKQMVESLRTIKNVKKQAAMWENFASDVDSL